MDLSTVSKIRRFERSNLRDNSRRLEPQGESRQLMVDFYRGLKTDDLTKAEALQEAQSHLRSNERFAHPYYWAPFTLVNDWL